MTATTFVPRRASLRIRAGWAARLLLAALLAAVLAIGSGAQVERAEAAETVTGTVTGVVRADAVNGSVQGGVPVHIVATYFDPEGYEARKYRIASTTSADDGTFSFTDIAFKTSSYYEYSLRTAVVESLPFFASTVPLAKPQGSPVVQDIVVLRGSVVTGRVTSSAAPQSALVGATISVNRSDGYPPVPAETTDAEGRFRSGLLEAGVYVVSAGAPGYQSAKVTRNVPGASVISGVDFVLTPLARIVGTVRDAAGSPIPGISVVGASSTAVTSADGSYVLSSIPTGAAVAVSFTDPSKRYTSYTAPPTPAAVAGQSVRVDATLQLPGSISGRVSVNQGPVDPVPPITVKVTLRDAPYSRVAQVKTDATGAYSVPNLKGGRYRVSFSAPELGLLEQWWQRSPTQAASTTVVVVGGTATTGIDATMESVSTLATVSGTVSLKSYPPRPEPGATVELVRARDGAAMYSTVTDQSGSYRVTGVLPGAYKVRFAPVNKGFLIQWLGGSATMSGSTTLTVDESVSGVDIALAMKKPFAVAPVPTISGTPAIGGNLLAVTGTWSPTPDDFSYQWLRSGIPIPGATSTGYTPSSEDAGSRITVAVRGSLGTDTAQTRTSASVGPVGKPLQEGPTPTITGTLKVGATISAWTGYWAPPPVDFAYSWKRDGVVISTAKSKSYVLTEADRGKAMSVTVTASKPGYVSVVKTTARSAPVLGALSSAPVPKVTGTTRVGSTLTAVTGVWQPEPVALKLVWKRNGVAIPGATAKSYRLQAADTGKKITVTVTGSKSGYASISRTSAPTTTVASG